MLIDIADVAAIIHADMCNDERNGYSWQPRTGGDHPDGIKRLFIGGFEYSYPLGSWDCSSSVIKAWQEAIKYTRYAGALDGATYTGNMRNVFVNSGLFEVWDTSQTIAQRGDIYLNDESHTAMCQTPDPDILSEFSMSESGDVYYNQVGDQTGWESHVTGYYDYPWWCTLHYNHAADFDSGEPAPSPAPVPSEADGPRYAACYNGMWFDDMIGSRDTGGSSDDFAGSYGCMLDYLAIEGVGQYRVCTTANGWLPYVDTFDKGNEEFGMAGDDSPIVAVEIPNPNVWFQCHTLANGWLDPMAGTHDTGGSVDTYGGDMTPIDAIRIRWS